ncbi:hypothetical protein AAGV27_14365 [Bacillus velezensis]|uniref:hypothetical protein n=1 Tax=Bacillus velezensis TaxID=492670 RepID=UPI0023E0E86A|nr:hypothetical protein [Bacillus velezensis]WES02350.1 hypothetical protein PX690_01520 [Bacillus velezensis]
MKKELDMLYGLRGFYTLGTYAILANSLRTVDNITAILSSFFLFLLPIALDYYNQQPLKEENRKRKEFSMWTALSLAFLVLILMMLTEVNFFVKNDWFKWGLWFGLFLFVYNAFVDWVAMSSLEEIKHREKVRVAYRKSIEVHETTTSDRLKYYDQKVKKERPSRERSQRTRSAQPNKTSTIIE